MSDWPKHYEPTMTDIHNALIRREPVCADCGNPTDRKPDERGQRFCGCSDEPDPDQRYDERERQ